VTVAGLLADATQRHAELAVTGPGAGGNNFDLTFAPSPFPGYALDSNVGVNLGDTTEITIGTAALYKITTSITLEQTGDGNTRMLVHLALRVNGTAVSESFGYMRQDRPDGQYTTITSTLLQSLTDTDVLTINVQGFRGSTANSPIPFACLPRTGAVFSRILFERLS
jgi:hypothetical protein